jgi:hypothetical protein
VDFVKKDCQNKLIKVLIVTNIILVALVVVLFMQLHSLQKQVDGAFFSIRGALDNQTRLETNLRNRKIIE